MNLYCRIVTFSGTSDESILQACDMFWDLVESVYCRTVTFLGLTDVSILQDCDIFWDLEMNLYCRIVTFSGTYRSIYIAGL